MALVFDIETIGEPFDELDAASQEVLTRWIKKESSTDEEYAAKLEEVKDGLGFSPLTGEIVAIGTLDSDTMRGAVYFQDNNTGATEFEENGIKYTPLNEKEQLAKFWELSGHYSEFVTFNGRAFDVPFIMIRSAIHGIRPAKNLVGPRYLYQHAPDAKHYDLFDLLSFYGTARFRGMNLHMWCRAFGIKSPKENGTTGDDVAGLFAEGKYADIARYNRDDIVATKELFDRWRANVRV